MFLYQFWGPAWAVSSYSTSHLANWNWNPPNNMTKPSARSDGPRCSIDLRCNVWFFPAVGIVIPQEGNSVAFCRIVRKRDGSIEECVHFLTLSLSPDNSDEWVSFPPFLLRDHPHMTSTIFFIFDSRPCHCPNQQLISSFCLFFHYPLLPSSADVINGSSLSVLPTRLSFPSKFRSPSQSIFLLPLMCPVSLSLSLSLSPHPTYQLSETLIYDVLKIMWFFAPPHFLCRK